VHCSIDAIAVEIHRRPALLRTRWSATGGRGWHCPSEDAGSGADGSFRDCGGDAGTGSVSNGQDTCKRLGNQDLKRGCHRRAGRLGIRHWPRLAVKKQAPPAKANGSRHDRTQDRKRRIKPPAGGLGTGFTPYRTWTPMDRSAATLSARVSMLGAGGTPTLEKDSDDREPRPPQCNGVPMRQVTDRWAPLPACGIAMHPPQAKMRPDSHQQDRSRVGWSLVAPPTLPSFSAPAPSARVTPFLCPLTPSPLSPNHVPQYSVMIAEAMCFAGKATHGATVEPVSPSLPLTPSLIPGGLRRQPFTFPRGSDSMTPALRVLHVGNNTAVCSAVDSS
jgi:hypothetical protein